MFSDSDSGSFQAVSEWERNRPQEPSLHVTSWLVLRATVEFGAHGGEGRARKDGIERYAEILGNAESEREAGIILAAFQVADRLVIDVDGRSELNAGKPSLGAQDRDPVIDPTPLRR